MRHTFTTLMLCGLAGCGVASVPTNASACAESAEAQALNVRALKSSLMVAALSCGQQDYYNTFVQRHESILTDGGATIKAYFDKHYGGKSDRELNRFVTVLANNAAQGSMASDDAYYCEETAEMFSILLQIDPPELANVAMQDRYASLHGIDGCL